MGARVSSSGVGRGEVLGAGHGQVRAQKRQGLVEVRDARRLANSVTQIGIGADAGQGSERVGGPVVDLGCRAQRVLGVAVVAQRRGEQDRDRVPTPSAGTVAETSGGTLAGAAGGRVWGGHVRFDAPAPGRVPLIHLPPPRVSRGLAPGWSGMGSVVVVQGGGDQPGAGDGVGHRLAGP